MVYRSFVFVNVSNYTMRQCCSDGYYWVNMYRLRSSWRLNEMSFAVKRRIRFTFFSREKVKPITRPSLIYGYTVKSQSHIAKSDTTRPLLESILSWIRCLFGATHHLAGIFVPECWGCRMALFAAIFWVLSEDGNSFTTVCFGFLNSGWVE